MTKTTKTAAGRAAILKARRVAILKTAQAHAAAGEHAEAQRAFGSVGICYDAPKATSEGN